MSANPEVLPVAQEGGPVAVTPMQLVQMAVQQGADVDKLEKLMQLQLRWEADQARKAYVVAMGAFKANPPKISKSKMVGFGTTKYKHATLDDASETIGAALAEHGISHSWEVQQEAAGKVTVTCILTHVQGHSERVSLSAAPDTSGSKNSIQAVGSTVSYLQRYSLFAATGIAPKDVDDDARGGGKGMPVKQKADFLAAIESLTYDEAAKDLWKTIATAAKEARDVDAIEELRTIMLAKRKAIKQ